MTRPGSKRSYNNENRVINSIDSKALLDTKLKKSEQDALKKLVSTKKLSDDDIAQSRKIYIKMNNELAAMNFSARIHDASRIVEKPIEQQKDLLPYILPKAPSTDTLNINTFQNLTDEELQERVAELKRKMDSLDSE